MNRSLLLIGLVVVVPLLAVLPRQFAESPDVTGRMEIANDLYGRGNFVDAAQIYQQLVAEGYEDSSLLYNLGNAYYKSGDLGRAILNYIRAARLAPRDPDIQVNLEIARNNTADLFEAADEPTLAIPIGLPHSRLTLDELALAALGLWLLLAILLLSLMIGQRASLRRRIRYASVVVTVLLVLGGAALGSRMYTGAVDHKVIIVVASVDVVGGPGPQYEAEFALHSGAEARLIETRGRWARLVLPGGQLRGWVPAYAMEPVVPR